MGNAIRLPFWAAGWGNRNFGMAAPATLEEQVLQPILNPDEMGMTLETVLQRLHKDPAYRGLPGFDGRDSVAGRRGR